MYSSRKTIITKNGLIKFYCVWPTVFTYFLFPLKEPSIIPVEVDLTDWDATRKAVEGVGPIHLLVNNAGVAEITPFLQTTKAEMDRYIFKRGILHAFLFFKIYVYGGGGGSRMLPECQTILSQIRSGSKLFDRLSADDTSRQKSLWHI